MEDNFFTTLEKKREAFVLDFYDKYIKIIASGLGAKGKKDKIQLEYAKAYKEEMESFLDRKYGKPMQRQQHSGDKENPVVYMPFEILSKHGATPSTETNSV